jgi:hypothetical protein
VIAAALETLVLSAVAAVPLIVAFGGAVFWYVHDRDEDVPVAHMESKRRRT